MTVSSNDPKTPQLPLQVSADVQLLLGMEPERLHLAQILQGTKKTATARLAGSLAEKSRLLSVESNRPEVQAVIEEEGKALRIDFQAPAKPERVNAVLKLKTDQEAARELTLYLAAEVTGELVLSTSFVMFGPYEPDSPPMAQVRVRSLTGKSFKVLKVEDPGGAVSASFTPLGTPPGSEVEVNLKLDKAPGAPRGSLTIHTDRPEQPVLPLQYNVRPKGMPAGRQLQMQPLQRGGAAPAPDGQPVPALRKGQPQPPPRVLLQPGEQRLQLKPAERKLEKTPPAPAATP